ncbi:MAG TPA: NAD(P)-dependent oxidoreductase, partial [Nitrososphaera sp.]|nr:NAD(P)-dependent oxidoreductase [Nitrososphaera sp.]
VVGDLTAPATLKFDGDDDVVCHFAALTPIERNKEKLAKVNYEGTMNLMDSVRDRTKSFVYASGLAVFDPGVEGGIVTESTPVNPDTEFVKMRIEAQRYLQEQCKDRGIDFTVVHFGDIVYGNGGSFKSMFIDRLKNGSFKIPGNGEYYKNFVHVDDAVNAVIAIIEKNAVNQSYIVTDSEPVLFKDFVYFAADRMGVKRPGTVPLILAKVALGGDLIKMLTKSMKASNEKIRRIYEFQYHSYKDGLAGVLEQNSS